MYDCISSFKSCTENSESVGVTSETKNLFDPVNSCEIKVLSMERRFKRSTVTTQSGSGVFGCILKRVGS